MLLELARPVVLLGCILALLGLFHAAFLGPAADVEQRLLDSLGPLLLATALALLGGLVFLSERRDAAALMRTFPMQIFCWSVAVMAVFFLAAWYLEAHSIFYRDVRY